MDRAGAAERGVTEARVWTSLREVHAQGSDHDEVEWQFDASDLGRVRRWLLNADHGPEVAVGPERVVTLVDDYYDTTDWRFHRAGYALRLRRRNGEAEVTLKSLTAASEGLHRRREVSVSLGRGRTLTRAPVPVGDRVRAVAGRRRLQPLFEVRTERRIVPLLLAGSPAGEVALDATLIPGSPGRRRRRLARVEVEVAPAAITALAPFVGSLRMALALVPATASKFEVGLATHALVPPPAPDFGPTAIDDTMTIGAVAFAALRRHLAALVASEPGTRLGDDPEALHRMRVATRRLRAALRTFADVLPPRAHQLRDELGLVGATLGAVRDLDVQIVALDRRRTSPRTTDGSALRGLIAMLCRRRALARRRMLRVLDSARYERLVVALATMARRGPRRRTRLARASVLAVAPDLVRRRYRKARKRGDAIDTAATASDYHALRIRCKHLRYALEFHAEVYGKPVRTFLRRLVALQDLLGAHQDAQVAAATLRDLVAHGGRSLPARARAAAGRVTAAQDRHARTLRARVPEAYRKVRGRRWKRLRDLLEKRRPARA